MYNSHDATLEIQNVNNKKSLKDIQGSSKVQQRVLSVRLLPPAGRSYCVRTQRMLNQCLESLVQKVQSGVVINFEKTGSEAPTAGEGGCH